MKSIRPYSNPRHPVVPSKRETVCTRHRARRVGRPAAAGGVRWCDDDGAASGSSASPIHATSPSVRTRPHTAGSCGRTAARRRHRSRVGRHRRAVVSDVAARCGSAGGDRVGDGRGAMPARCRCGAGPARPDRSRRCAGGVRIVDPVAGPRAFPEPWRDAADNAYGLLLEVVTPPADQPTAAELLADTIASSSATGRVADARPAHECRRGIRRQPGDRRQRRPDRRHGRGGRRAGQRPCPTGRPSPWPPSGTSTSIRRGGGTWSGQDFPITLVGLDATNQVPRHGRCDRAADGERHDRRHASRAAAARPEFPHRRTCGIRWRRSPPPTRRSCRPTPATIAVTTEGDDAGHEQWQAPAAHQSTSPNSRMPTR